MIEALIYKSSREIVDYITDHPVEWGDRDAARIGGVGDVMPPTPVMGVFLALLKKHQRLFSQSEFWDYCLSIDEWHAWRATLEYAQLEGFKAKIYGNFYPAAMDQLHAWALLVEAGWFDSCVIDSLTDAVHKHDLIVSRKRLSPIALDVFVASSAAIRARQYKARYRRTPDGITYQTYEVQIPMSRPRNPGNKRWLCLKDFERVHADYCYQHSLWDTAIVPCTCGHHHRRRLA